MSDTKKANALLKAAKAGEIKAIRTLLAGGVSIESTDLNKKTPVMLAAQAGHAEAFHLLVSSGANLEVMALGDTDLLDCAAEGGNVEIIRFLLDKGHPVEGRWKPRFKVDKRMGHFTPLMQAAVNGHVEAVRMLLEAGADRSAKFDGEDSLKRVQGEIKYPLDDETAAKKPRYQAIAALLKGKATESSAPDNSTEKEVVKFAKNAKLPAFLKLRQMLDEKCGPHRPWKPVPDHGIPAAGVVSYTLASCKKQKTIEDLQAEARKAECQLVLSEPWAPGEDAVLALFPTDNKFAVIAAVGTCGANDSVRTADVIALFAKLDAENSFSLVLCRHDAVAGTFARAPKGAKKLAEQMVELCSTCLDDEAETVEELAALLKKRKSFFLWWD